MTEVAAPVPDLRPRRSYIAGVVNDTLKRLGAKFGVAWLLFIAFCAVFAPLIANTHPIVMKTRSGEVTSPLAEHLTSADVILMILTVVIVPVLFFVKWLSLGQRLVIFIAALIVVMPLCLMIVKPPLTVVYDKYREMARAGEIEWAVYTPIPYSPTDRQRDLPERQRVAPFWGSPRDAPAAEFNHWLGTDTNGADAASRLIHACRIALAVGFIATGIALIIGVILGGLMGYFSGVVDLIGMRLVEIFESIPQLYLLLTFVAFFPRNLYIIMAIIGLTSWSGYARFIRAEFLKIRKQDYVQAARACGLPLRSILFKHMLPNGVAPVLVSATFGVASAILSESVLSFLGLGLVDEPSWGQMLNEAITATGGFSWWIAIFPGFAIFLTVFAYNLVGESLRDAIDPYTKREVS